MTVEERVIMAASRLFDYKVSFDPLNVSSKEYIDHWTKVVHEAILEEREACAAEGDKLVADLGKRGQFALAQQAAIWTESIRTRK